MLIICLMSISSNSFLKKYQNKIIFFCVTFFALYSLSPAQAEYIGVSPDGPFKPDYYRY